MKVTIAIVVDRDDNTSVKQDLVLSQRLPTQDAPKGESKAQFVKRAAEEASSAVENLTK